MDDHHPAGLLYPGQPTIFHAAPSPYGIPYRSLYSRNLANLFFAGRNISVTHAALSSTRVMGTCAIIGQAAGTAAALCVKQQTTPRSLDRVALQRALLDDDCWLPGVPRPIAKLALAAKLVSDGQDAPLLLDGTDRDRPEQSHAWKGGPGAAIEYHWNQRQRIAGMRIIFDSNLQLHKRMPCTYPHKLTMPHSLVKAYRLETRIGGEWRTVMRATENQHRLVRVPLQVEAEAVRLVVEETWGDPVARVFACEPLADCEPRMPVYPIGPAFSEVRAQANPADLQPPASIVVDTGRRSRRISA